MQNQNILIDSLQRSNINNPTHDFTVRFVESIKVRNSAKINLKYANIPSTYHNLSTLSMNMNDGVVSTLILAAGNYTRASLITTINTNLQAQSATYLVSYNANSLKVTIENTGPINFDLNFAVETRLARLLGFTQTNLTGAASYTGTLTPQLLLRYCIIDISGMSSSHTDSVGNFKFIVPLTTQRTEINEITSQSFFNQLSDLNYISQVDVRLKDEFGNPLDLNGADIFIILGIDN